MTAALRALLGMAAAGLALPAAWAHVATAPAAPVVQARARPLLTVDGLKFKDSNADGKFDGYEDWRRPVEARVADLVAQMTLQEEAGLMLVQTLNGGCEGALQSNAAAFVNQQQMHRFILRHGVNAQGSCGQDAGIRAGSQLTPQQAAKSTHGVQALAEATRLGIPALFKSNARNHFERDARTGINNSSCVKTEFPKEAGIAAAALGDEFRKTGKASVGDTDVVRRFAHVMGAQWQAVGIRGLYGDMADLATEPRWYRVHEIFTEDADLATNLMKTLVENLQGGPRNPKSPVALTMKHFPGGGPQELGLDPHCAFGKNPACPAGNFGWRLQPWQAAVDAGVASIMPYCGVPIDVTHEGIKDEQAGFAFSKQGVTGLLRSRLGFKGCVDSDTGIIDDRAWGLEGKTVPERVAAAINGGTDTLSGFNGVKTITDLVGAGLVGESRITEAARRPLQPMFELGLFENPYVDDDKAGAIVGQAAFREAGLDVQRKSVLLLQNNNSALPVAANAKVYAMGLDTADAQRSFAQTVNGEAGADGKAPARDAAGKVTGRPSAAGFDGAIIRVEVGKVGTNVYRSKDPATGANPAFVNPLTGKVWGTTDQCIPHAAADPQCVDDGHLGGPSVPGLVFGGAFAREANTLSFTTMAASKSWRLSPSLADIQAVMKEIGVGNAALLDVLAGKARPQGKLPFALASNLQPVIDNQPDAPGYPFADTLFPFGHAPRY